MTARQIGHESPLAVSRRTLVGGAAFAVPAIIMTTSTPAMAVSGTVQAVEVALGRTPVAPGESTSVTAKVTDANGTGLAAQVVTLTASDSSVTLANTSGATDSSGVFATTASVANGTADKTVTVTASAGGKSGTAALSVQTRGVVTGRTSYAGVPAGTAMSSDGSKLYIVGRSVVSGAMRRTVSVVDPSTFAVISTISLHSQLSDNPLVARLSPDGSRLVVMTESGWAVLDTSSDSVLTYRQYGSVGFTDIDINGDNHYLYLTMGDGIFGLDATNPSATQVRYAGTSASTNGAGNLILSADSSRLFFVERKTPQGNLLKVVDVATKTVLSSQTIATSFRDVTSFVLSPDGTKLHAATRMNGAPVVRTVDTSTYAVVSTVTLPADMCDVVATPDGSRLILLDGSGNTYALDIASGSVSTLAAPPVSGTSVYQALSIAPSGNTVFATIAPSSGWGRVFGVTT